MTLFRIVDVGVNSTFKDGLEILWFGMRLLKQSGKVDVQKRGNVTDVEEADMAQVNRALMK